MSVVVPNAFASRQGNVPAVELDQNFNALADAISATGTVVTLTGTASENRDALQEAIDAATVNSLLLIPGGSFALQGDVTIPKGLALRGNGRGLTTLSFTTGGLKTLTDNAVILADMSITSAGGPQALLIDGLTGIGNGNTMLLNLAVASTTGDGIYIFGAFNVTVDNCHGDSYAVGGSGLRIANHFAPDSGGNLIRGSVFKGKLAGIRHDSGAGLTIADCIIFDPDQLNQYGILLQGTFLVPAAETIIANTDIATSTVIGIYINPSDPLPGTGYYAGLQINGVNIRGDQGGGGGIDCISGGAAALVITGCTLGAGANHPGATVILEANGMTIVGNHFQHTVAGEFAIAIRPDSANVTIVGNRWFANIQQPDPIVVDTGAQNVHIEGATFSFAQKPPIATLDNGCIFYIEDGTPSTDPLTGGGAGAMAITQSGAYRGL